MFVLSQLLLPILVGVIAYVFFKKAFSWKEILCMEIISIIVIAIGYFAGIYSLSSDTEYWTENIQYVQYNEPYETWVTKTCTKEEEDGKDAQGNTKYKTVTYDCSECEETPAYYFVHCSNGSEYTVSENKYYFLSAKFKQPKKFIEMNRSIDYYSGCGKDGDAYRVNWAGEWYRAEAFTTSHTYENKVQFSNSLFNSRELEEEEVKKVYDYPVINSDGYQKPIIGTWYNNKDLSASTQYLDWYNAMNGSKRQIKLFVFIYKDQPESIGELQKEFFKSGNKNEYILVLNYRANTHEINWYQVITWCEKNAVKSEMSQFIYTHRNATMYDITTKMCSVMDASWQRKSFSDFDYLYIQPSDTAWIFTFVFSAIALIVMSILFYNNDYFE